MLFQGSSFSFDPGMFLSAFLYASSAAFFFAWSSAFGASCCCLFPFAIALTGATTASNAIAIGFSFSNLSESDRASPLP
jgi:fucose permease